MEDLFFPYYLFIGGVMDQQFLREKIREYIKDTGIKQYIIAKEIGETPNNFSRWLTGKRNYGDARKQLVINYLINRGVLNVYESPIR